jgi:agmatine/peptidylarginine deiminase
MKFPAEWEPQSGVLLAWPHDEGDWQPQLEVIERTYAEIAAAISRFEPALILCRNQGVSARAERACRSRGIKADGVSFHLIRYDDTWIRDTGPLCIRRREAIEILDFGFNAWGGRYAHEFDSELAFELHRMGLFGRAPLRRFPFVLEGGSVETDGAGTLMTTRSCLLSPSRNPGMDRSSIEVMLKEALGIERILWLTNGRIEGDDTDGHVDTLARFCDPQTIAYSACTDRDDAHWDSLGNLEMELRALQAPDGKPYRLIPLPLPAPVLDSRGLRLPANYANFLILNGAVLIPSYADPADATVLERLRPAFPGRELVPIDCRPLITQFGSLHCMSMQLPEGALS